LPGSTSMTACRPKPLFGGTASCNTADPSIMTNTLCAALAGQNSVTVPTAAALGTSQLVRYTFINSWGCNEQETLPAAQRISGPTPNQVLACESVPGSAFVKADAPCEFACDEHHILTDGACRRVCGNVTSTTCATKQHAAEICSHAGHTFYTCEACSNYIPGTVMQPFDTSSPSSCPTQACPAGTSGENGACTTCPANTFCASPQCPACTPCARGTFSRAGSSVCETCFEDAFDIDVNDYSNANVVATRGVSVVLNWPQGHPALITTSTAVSWNGPVEFTAPLFEVVVDEALYQTTFTVPENYSGQLFYICRWHSSMGINEISLAPATPCAAGTQATRSVADIDLYFARALSASHNVSRHSDLFGFCKDRVACLPCMPGEYEADGACVACDYAHYQPNFQMPHCFECALGHNTTGRGSMLADNCLCQPGFE
jgi:hypothetical protein